MNNARWTVWKRVDPLFYLGLVHFHRLTPNFWCSLEYFRRAGWECWEGFPPNAGVGADSLCIVTDADGPSSGISMLPPLWRTGLGATPAPAGTVREIWADFEECSAAWGPTGPGRGWTTDALDLEIIYNPTDFRDLSGGHWRKFRKNIRRFDEAHPGAVYGRAVIRDHGDMIREIAARWLDSRPPDVAIEDSETLLKYLDDAPPGRVEVLMEGSRLLGVNIWDETHGVAQFRYCLCDPDVEKVSEALRLRFMLARAEEGRCGRVNDGGTLGNVGLALFKRSLNPCNVRPVKTWKREETETT